MGLKLFDGKMKIRWQLMLYDIIVYVIVISFVYATYGRSRSKLEEFVVFSLLWE